jgi:hypothetical protein
MAARQILNFALQTVIRDQTGQFILFFGEVGWGSLNFAFPVRGIIVNHPIPFISK